MPDVSSLTEFAWGPGTFVAPSPLHVLWGRATDVQSIGGPYTPGPPPIGGTPISPNTDADYVIGPAASRNVHHVIAVTDLRDNSPVQLDAISISVDDGAICWTLNANGPASLFESMTTGDTPIIDVEIDGFTWRFIVEGVRRSREFPAGAVTLTGRSPTIMAGEPYQFTQNWVNDGPATAQQLAAQAQVFNGLEIDWRLEDWLVPDRVFSFTGTPLNVVQRVTESVGGVTRPDRVETRVALHPRYRAMPNRWRVEVPEVQIHVDAHMTDAWERADKPAFNGVFVSGEAEGIIARVYLAGTSGERLAPMLTDQLMTEEIAARQRGESFLGQGGPQATVTITLPFLTGSTYPGPFECGWLVRVVEPSKPTFYGMVRAVSIGAEFGYVTQTITLEVHTADITGTIIPIPAPPPPADGEIAWYEPIYDHIGSLAHANSGVGNASAFAPGGITALFAGLVGWSGQALVWSIEWNSPDGHPAPVISDSSAGWVQITWVNTYEGESPGLPLGDASIGTLVLTATVDGGPIAAGQRLIAVTTPDESDSYPNIAWGPEP